MNISFITTVFNEEKTIEKFLDSLFSQTKLPDEIIIVDGHSSDKTVKKIENYIAKHKKKNFVFKLVMKKGNRSVGRNEAIKNATGNVIVCSDSGNILDKNWLKNIINPFSDPKVDVVAGYYKGLAKNVFQKCLIPYVLVMPDKVDPQNFLPATRSIGFTKSIWKKVGGFDEKFSHNEDYVFANKLKEVGAKIIFAKDAIVYWFPRKTFKEAFIMFFRFALGDAESGIWRTNVLLLLARYFLAIYFIFLALLYKSPVPIGIIVSSFILYSVWAIKKNYRYVRHKDAYKIFPLMQFTADFAVLSGTIMGVVKKIRGFNYFLYINQNKFFFFILLVYISIMLYTMHWGTPNQNHPFPYHMDEWHQLQAVRATFKYGTPNVFGAANGTMFHFLLSGLYLAPFALVDYINPVVLKVNDLAMRERLFELLRINTILWGVLSLFALYIISKIVNAPKKLVLFLFTFTPVWLSVSGYFKYDIALMFWILLSMIFFIRFLKDPSNRNFVLAAIPPALAFSVKVSAIPLFAIYIFSFFWFQPLWKKNLKYFFVGISIFISCIFLFGVPDTIFGKGNIMLYFYENVISAPQTTSNFQLGMSSRAYLLLHNYPIIFGHGLVTIFVIGFLFWIYTFFRVGIQRFRQQYQIELFLFFSLLVFIISMLPLDFYAIGSRAIVLLPFIVLIIGLAWKQMTKEPHKGTIPLIFLVILVTFVQLYESFAWVYMKVAKSPQEASSEWVIKNIQKGQVIGLENIPIYQNIPEVVQKEFYFNQYKIPNKNRYTYQIIDAKSKTLPSVVILTNEQEESKIYYWSVKRDLLNRLGRNGYKKIAVFSPDFTYYKVFGTDMDYYLSYIAAAPITVTIYKK